MACIFNTVLLDLSVAMTDSFEGRGLIRGRGAYWRIYGNIIQVRAFTNREWRAWSDAVSVETPAADGQLPVPHEPTGENNHTLVFVIFLQSVVIVVMAFILGVWALRRKGHNKKQPSDLDVLDYQKGPPFSPTYVCTYSTNCTFLFFQSTVV